MSEVRNIIKILKKELGRYITVQKLHNALERRGISLVFTNTEEGCKYLELFNLTDYSKEKKAFLFIDCVKIVFVDGTQYQDDIIKLILHEMAHYELGHIGPKMSLEENKTVVSKEIEADAVVYGVLNGVLFL